MIRAVTVAGRVEPVRYGSVYMIHSRRQQIKSSTLGDATHTYMVHNIKYLEECYRNNRTMQ